MNAALLQRVPTLRDGIKSLGRSGIRPYHGMGGVPTLNLKGPFGAPSAGQFEARFEEVGGKDVYAAQAQQAGEDQANRPLARDEHDIAAQQSEPFNGFEDGVDG